MGIKTLYLLSYVNKCFYSWDWTLRLPIALCIGEYNSLRENYYISCYQSGFTMNDWWDKYSSRKWNNSWWNESYRCCYWWLSWSILIMTSIFSKIIVGEIPSYKLYEDEYTFAFLDIFPQVPGHTIIVPKIEVDHFTEVPEPYYSAIFQTAKKLAPALKSATNCHRVCTAFLGYQIPHCHYQLLPTQSEEDFRWRPMPQANSQDLKVLQEKILSHLENR